MNNFSRMQKGLTLIEAMVVIAIVAILASLAAPSFLNTTQRFRVIREVNAFMGDLQLARSAAIKEGLPVTMCASSDGASCSGSESWEKGWIVFSDHDADQTVDSDDGDTLSKMEKAWTGTDTFTADNSVSAITFNREGFSPALSVTAASGVSTFTAHTTSANNAATKCIAINKAGRLEVQNPGTGACE